jgi:hypothetical protein
MMQLEKSGRAANAGEWIGIMVNAGGAVWLVGKRAAPLQQEGFAGGHHQGSQMTRLLLEAGPETPRQAGVGP